jgi:uncharacterized membrane protein YphA (DoxX/SURF4 family)
LPPRAEAGTMRGVNFFTISNRAWAIFFARLVLGLIFGMAGWGKVFKMGPVGHAHRFFVDPYASTWIPTWLLWSLGLSIPFVELLAGWLVFAGLFVRPSLIALGLILAIVTYGHLLKDFLYEFHTHVIPRLALLIFILAMPSDQDQLSLDHWLGHRW